MGKKSPPDELRSLIQKAGLNNTTAAESIGMTARAFRQYLAGDRPVPLVVILAMRWIVQDRAS